MFYTTELLARRDSGFGLLWLAATLGSKSTLKRLTKKSVLTADIAHLCGLIAEPAEPLALRLSSNLMIGVARVYKLKHEIFVADVTQAYTSLKKAVQDMNSWSTRVDPKSLQMAQGSASLGSITLDLDMPALNFDFDYFAHIWESQPSGEEIAAYQDISAIPAHQGLHTIDEAHLSFSQHLKDSLGFLGSNDFADSSGGNDDFGDFGGGDFGGIDLGLGEELGWAMPENLAVPATPPIVANDDMFQDFGLDMGMDIDMGDLPVQGLDLPPSEMELEHQSMDLGEDGPTAPLEDAAGAVAEDLHPIRGEGVEPSDKPPKTQKLMSKSKKPKKQVRFVFDQCVDLKDSQASENYVEEQNKLRFRMEQEEYKRKCKEVVDDMFMSAPDIIHAPELRELWDRNFLIQTEPRLASARLHSQDNHPDASRSTKMKPRERKGEGSSVARCPLGEVAVNPNIGNGGGEAVANWDTEGFMDGDFGLDIDMGGYEFPTNDRIRSSEEPERARAGSRAPSIRSLEFGKDRLGRTGRDLPIADSSSALGGYGLGSFDPGNQDDIQIRSRSGSLMRRSISVDFRGSNILENNKDINQQRLEILTNDEKESHTRRAPPKTLKDIEDAWLTRGDNNLLQLEDIIPNDIIPTKEMIRRASDAFYNCLVLATSQVIRLGQEEPYGRITIELL